MAHSIILPEKYYLTHFKELLQDIKERFHPFLLDEHHQFLHDFQCLPEDAQCMYVRLVNRKGIYFFKQTLLYAEIANHEHVLEILKEKGFIREPGLEDRDGILEFLPKKELLEMLKKNEVHFRASWKRDALKSLALACFSLPQDVIVQTKMEEINYLLFLYFGDIQESLTLYTLRDLGIRQANKYKGTFKPKFKSLEEARTQYFYALLRYSLDTTADYREWPLPLNAESRKIREELLLYLAELHRKEENFEEALNILKVCEQHPAREKLARLLYQLDRKDECLELLNKIIDEPSCDEECFFAEDFLARKFEKKKLSLLTETLKNAKKISIDEGYFRHPEFGMVEWFKAQGIEAFITENYLWNSLFGLLFWEELFESSTSAIHSQFDYTPFDLVGADFYQNHEANIHAKLDLIEKKEAAEFINQVLKQKYDVPNGIFGWSEELKGLINTFLSAADPVATAKILMTMARNYENASTGYPDLMTVENGQVKFFEIKAEGDSLRNHQLKQLYRLKQSGFDVDILQVVYDVNPAQTYVVVDLETTGISATFNRITEIGAVKIRDGIVIDTFQSLVNPEQNIPRRIQDLTGITNEMVEDAPKFSEIADTFNDFTQGAIFVAHNVKFDYSFLQSEFQRLDKKFVRPFICTSAGMKKHYPGLGSYGLGNLTTHFGISLTHHHRALCDAEAAAQLLLLINLKRRELIPV